MKNDPVPFFFSLLADPLTARVIFKCPGCGHGNNAQGDGFGSLFFMFVYAHGNVIGVACSAEVASVMKAGLECWSIGVLNPVIK